MWRCRADRNLTLSLRAEPKWNAGGGTLTSSAAILGSRARRQRLRRAMATARFASACSVCVCVWWGCVVVGKPGR